MWKSMVVVTLVGFLTYKWIQYKSPQPPPTKVRESAEDAYDYIIVGGGTAGCVLANRLSDNPDNTVLLLEAGDDDAGYPAVHVPSRSLELLGNPGIDWSYKTVPQKHACQSMKNNQSFWTRGKLLGGCSSHNNLIFMRGSPHDFDRWEELGAKGWSYRDVLPYFKKLETNKNPAMVANGYHGDKGPVVVTDMNYTNLHETFLAAGEELGYPQGDVNGETHDNMFMHMQANVDDGVRASTAHAYLRPAQGRPNLHIVVKAHVTKVVFVENRAIGVLYRKGGETRTVKVNKEVILSSGTIGSAQILLLSGVGPRKHLEDLKINVVADLPVGQNLMDHLQVIAQEHTSSGSIRGDMIESHFTELQYTLFRRGLRAATLIEGNAFFTVPHQPQEDKFSHLQIEFCIFNLKIVDGLWQHLTNFFNGKDDIFEAVFAGDSGKGGLMFVPMLLHPKSTGTIKLASKNPMDHPLIDPNYLSHPDDIKTLLAGVRKMQQLASTKAFKGVDIQLEKVVHPSCKHEEYDSDSYWECYIRNMASTVFHPTSSCKMGAANDPTSVVDSQLRVRGLVSIRVADASIMPMVTSGNIHAPVIMIAEKAADLINSGA